MINAFLGLFSYDLGIDLGTANTLVHVRGKGIMVREPSVVARHKKTKQVLAIGSDAKKMLGKTPQTIEAIRPLRDGVISDFDATAAMLRHYIQFVHETPKRSLLPRIPRPKVVIGIPSGVTEVERRAVQEAALLAGAREAYLIEEPMAGAIGSGLPIEDSTASFICDIGGGTTEIAVVSLGGIVVNKSIRTAGDEMDEAIVQYMKHKHALLIGEKTAEDVKLSIGSAFKSENADGQTIVRGRSWETGLPTSVKLTESEVIDALKPVLQEITDAIALTIEESPPEMMGDIIEKGIVLAGGGALIKGIDRLIATELKMPVWIAEDPLTAVVRGCGMLLENEALLKKVAVFARK
jgi:rod shape-determining protein MreB and related proteins